MKPWASSSSGACGLHATLRSPEVVTQVWREISKHKDKATASMDEVQVSVALSRIALLWDQLFPMEQYRIVTLLVDRVIVSTNELQVKL